MALRGERRALDAGGGMKAVIRAFFFLILGCAASGAVESPRRLDVHVNDFAGVVEPGDEEAIRDLFFAAKAESGIDVSLLTITALGEYGVQSGLRQYAARLAREWKMGDPGRNNGILVLFSKNDREVWIETGNRYGYRQEAALQRVVDGRMLPHFRKGEYSRGLTEGARGIFTVVTGRFSWLTLDTRLIVQALFGAACVCAGVSCLRAGRNGWGFVFFQALGTLLLVAFVVVFSPGHGRRRRFRRWGRRGGRIGGGGIGGGRGGGGRRGGAGGRW